MLFTSTRKIIIAFFISVLAMQFSYSQSCVIDTTNYQLIYPNTSDLPCVQMNVPYATTLQFFIPPAFAGFTVDSIWLTNLANLPTGITYTFNPAPCHLKPYERGCVLISGTTTDTAGDYPFDYNGTIFLTQGSPTFDYIRTNFPGQMPSYDLFVVPQGDSCGSISTGISRLNSNARVDFSVFPNPNSGRFEIQLSNNNYEMLQINIIDVTGRKIYSQTEGESFYKASIDFSTYPKGLYLIKLCTDNGVISKNILIE